MLDAPAEPAPRAAAALLCVMTGVNLSCALFAVMAVVLKVVLGRAM